MTDSNTNDKATILGLFKTHPILILTFTTLLCSAVGYWSEYALLREFDINVVIFAEADDFLLAGLKNPKIFFVSFPLFACGIGLIMYLLSGLEQFARDMSHCQSQLIQELKDNQSELNNEDCDSVSKQERLKGFKRIEEDVKEQQKTLHRNMHTERRRSVIYIIATVMITLILIFVLLKIELNSQLERIIRKPTVQTFVTLRNGVPLQSEIQGSPLILITATGDFVFFYQSNPQGKGKTFIVPISSIMNIQHENIQQ